MLRILKRGGVILGALLALVGCQSEKLVDDGGSLQEQQFSLTASKGIMSRTHLGSDGKQTVWSEGDKIYVSSADGKVTGVLTLTSKPGDVTGTFSGFVFGNPDKLAYSVFPVPTNGKTIDLSKVTGGDKLNAPMVGQINNKKNVEFQNTAGTLRVDLQNSKDKNFTISAKSDNEDVKLLTTATIKVVDGIAQLVYTESDKGTIALENAVGGFMYIPFSLNKDVKIYVDDIEITEIESDNFTGKLKQEDVKTLTYSEKTKSLIEPVEPDISQSQICNGTLTVKISSSSTDGQPEGDGNTTQQEVHEFINIPSITEALESTTEVTEVIVELPKIAENSSATQSVVSFEEIPTGVAVEIKEETSTNDNKTESVKQLTVILPSVTTKEEAKEKVVIDMPNTTVTVKSADGNVLLIKEMVAETADETLIIEKDVEIGSLSILKGSVQVYGTIGSLKREQNNQDSKTLVTIEVGGRVGKIEGDGFTIVDKNQYEEVEPEEEEEKYEGNPGEHEIALKKAAKNGGSFTVTEYLRLTSPLIIEKDFVLNFNNGAFDGDEGQFVDSKGWKAMVVVKPGATFTFNGGGYFNTGHKETQISCIRMVGGSDASSKVIINDGSLIGTYHDILIDEDCQNAEVEINGGGLSCDWWNEFHGVNIFNKSDAKITIKGGSLTSYGDTKISSIEMWGGELNISGGQFDTNLSTVQSGLNVNTKVGNTLIGPAIAIAPKKDVTVNISGGTFTGDGASSMMETIVDETLLGKVNVSLSITGGTFNAPVTSQNCTAFISGGKFKVQPKNIYMAEGMSASLNGDYYEIKNGVTDGNSDGNNFGNGGVF